VRSVEVLLSGLLMLLVMIPQTEGFQFLYPKEYSTGPDLQA
jgi:hypothetical protein